MKPKLIMLLEDDEQYAQELIEMIVNIKDEWGNYKYEMVWGKNGKEGFELLRKYRGFMNMLESQIKCIISDIKMPEMDGIQFITELRKRERNSLLDFPFMPVVFLTAYEDDEKWKAAIKGLVTAYINKEAVSAVRIEDLLARILEEWDGEVLMELTREKGLEKREMYAKEKQEKAGDPW